MAMLYRQQMTPAELLVLTEQWEEIFRDMADDEFISAVKEHCRDGKYFPCPADVVEAHKVVKSRVKYVYATPLPEYDDPGKLKRAYLNASLIRHMQTLHPDSPLRYALLDEFSGPDAVTGQRRLQRIMEVLGEAYNGKGFAVPDDLPQEKRMPRTEAVSAGRAFESFSLF